VTKDLGVAKTGEAFDMPIVLSAVADAEKLAATAEGAH
jgi:hypothetical protein